LLNESGNENGKTVEIGGYNQFVLRDIATQVLSGIFAREKTMDEVFGGSLEQIKGKVKAVVEASFILAEEVIDESCRRQERDAK